MNTKNSSFKNDFIKPVNGLPPGVYFLTLALLVWFFSPIGKLHLIPSAIGLVWLAYDWFLGKKPFRMPGPVPCPPGFFICFYAFFASVFISIPLLSLYSFRWNVWDVGFHGSSIHYLKNYIDQHGLFLSLKNFIHESYFNPYFKAPALADHFTPSLALFVPFFWIGESSLWLMLAKTLSFVCTPLVVYLLLGEKEISKEERFWLTALFGVFF